MVSAVKLGTPNGEGKPAPALVSITRQGLVATKTSGCVGSETWGFNVASRMTDSSCDPVASDLGVGCQYAGADQFLRGTSSIRGVWAITTNGTRTITKLSEARYRTLIF